MPYNIYRDGSLIASNVLTEEYTDTDLEYGKEYSYQISSLNFYGESELSPAVKVTTLPLTLDVNGTVKTGTFAEKTLDEDAYDDLTVKDSNTVYKVYPEGGNPDEAAWFLGEQPVDSAKEGDTVVYGRNYARDMERDIDNSSGNPLRLVADSVEVTFAGENRFIRFLGITNPKNSGKYISSISATLQDNIANTLVFGLRFRGEGEGTAGDTYEALLPLQTTVITHRRDVTEEVLSKGLSIVTAPVHSPEPCTVLMGKLKVESGEKVTPYTVAPEDVAIFTEATGGAAA